MGNFEFSKYCTPAQLYLVLGGIGIITAFFNKFSIETLLTNALLLVIWAWVLNWLCSKGLKAISWILVLLPFIMALFTYFLAKDVVMKEGYALSDDPKKRASEIATFDAINKANAAAAAAAAKNAIKPTNIPAVDNSVNPTLSKIVDIGTSLIGG